MKDMVQALAGLDLTGSRTGDYFVSPRSTAPRPQSDTLRASCHVSLFPDLHRASAKQPETADQPEASWSAIVGDLFQAVVERLPAHTAQHAMLVCRQWHDCVTNGLVCLRPRALRLNCISSRSVVHISHLHLFQCQLHCAALHCAALDCTALHCTGLHCTALHCTALHCTALHCTALHCTALHCMEDGFCCILCTTADSLNPFAVADPE